MTEITVKALGSGTRADPYRVPLPTYGQAVFNHQAGTVSCTVPDDDAPAASESDAAWGARLSRKYARPFSPAFVASGRQWPATLPAGATSPPASWDERNGAWGTYDASGKFTAA